VVLRAKVPEPEPQPFWHMAQFDAAERRVDTFPCGEAFFFFFFFF
jgi:hypothetical protein